MAGHVAAELAVAVTARLLQHRARALVDADRHAQILGCFVDGIVVGARQGAAAELVGAPEDPHQTELLTGVTQLLDGPGGILQGQQHDAAQARVVVAAILREPSVVGTADGRAQLGVDVRAPHDVEAHGREQDAEIDPLPVHVADVRRGIETRGDGFRKRIAPRLVGGKDEPVIGDLAVGPPFGVRDGLAVDVAAGLVRSGDLHPPAELLRHVPVINIRRLHNMPIRIDDTKSVLHGSAPSSNRRRAASSTLVYVTLHDSRAESASAVGGRSTATIDQSPYPIKCRNPSNPRVVRRTGDRSGGTCLTAPEAEANIPSTPTKEELMGVEPRRGTVRFQ